MNLSGFTELKKLALSPSDTAGRAKHMMKEGHSLEIPVVENEKCIGTISEASIHSYDDSTPIDPNDLRKPVLAEPVDPIPVLWRKFMDNQCSTLVFEDSQHHFMGYATVWDIAKIYQQVLGIGEFNCLLVLKMRKLDYSLSKLAVMAEDTECHIMNTFVIPSSDQENIYVNLDLDSEHPEGFIQALERHEIEVERFLCKSEKEDVLQERLDMLMSYLNV